MDTTVEKSASESKLELYSLLNQGYNDIKEGRVIPFEEVEEKIQQRRANRGKNSIR